jgi:hypothetical protein
MESFFENYQHTFSAMAAIGTMLAVISSLYLTRRIHKPKIYAKLKVETKYFFAAPDDQPSWRFIVVDVINLDSMPIQIQANSFRISDTKSDYQGYFLHPIDYIDESYCPYHPLEDIEHKYHTDDKGGHESHNPLAKEMKEYPVLINSGDSKKFYFVEEGEYIDSFSNLGLIKKVLIRAGLFFLCYRPKIILYNKFIFRIKLSKGLKTKIKEKVIKNKL